MKTTTTSDSKLTNFIAIVKKAKTFAIEAHKDQYRKGGLPYITHPETVAKILHGVKSSRVIGSLIVAALLHDVVEDTDVTIEEIREEFGELVANLVNDLTSDLEKLVISGKEEFLIDKMLNMKSWPLSIKLSDRLHNLYDFEDIMAGDDEKRKEWVVSYANQTKNIISELEWYRELSTTQKELVSQIKNAIAPYTYDEEN